MTMNRRPLVVTLNLDSASALSTFMPVHFSGNNMEESLMKKMIGLGLVALTLCGCVSVSTDKAIIALQSETAQGVLGLASSDELTISRVVRTKTDIPGTESVSYRATTAKGRILDCKADLMAGTILTEPTVMKPDCTTVKAY